MARAERPQRGRNFRAPHLSKPRALERIRKRNVARQAVRQDAHVRCAARIRVVAERHVAGLSREARAERHQILNRGPLHICAENNHDIGFFFDSGLQRRQIICSIGVELAFSRCEPADSRPLRAFRDINS